MEEKELIEKLLDGDDPSWKLVWENVIVPEMKTLRSGELAKKYCVTDGDLFGRLYMEMVGDRKLENYRGDGSLWGWLRAYVRGYVTQANPAKHGEFSLEATAEQDESGEAMDLPARDIGVARNEAWLMTHRCFKDLWNDDPRKAYVLLLKTRFFLSSEEVAAMLEIPSAAAVDQIFSRSVKFMRAAWPRHDREG